MKINCLAVLSTVEAITIQHQVSGVHHKIIEKIVGEGITEVQKGKTMIETNRAYCPTKIDIQTMSKHAPTKTEQWKKENHKPCSTNEPKTRGQ